MQISDKAFSLLPSHTSHQLSNSLDIRPFHRTDRKMVRRLLSFLPDLYPDGDQWLENRLTDVIFCKAICTVITSRERVVGVAIETPKGRSSRKLSTIYIDPSARGLNGGFRLLDSCVQRWISAGINQTYVTVDFNREAMLRPLLVKFGFEFEATERSRYGAFRDELVFRWKR